jgi:hypothetical protein
MRRRHVAKWQRLNPNQEWCSPYRSIRRSPRERPQWCRSENRGSCKLAVECRQRRKEKTRWNSGSRRKSAAACRKVSRRAKVTWRKRNLFRKTGTQENCYPRYELTVAGMRMTRSANVARRRGHGRRWYDQDSMGQEAQKQRKVRKTLWKGLEYNSGLRDRGLRRQLQVKIVIKDPCTRRQLRLRIEKTSGEIFRGKIAKQVVGTSSGLRRIRKWTLWSGQPHPKRKKKQQMKQERVIYKHRPQPPERER